MPTAIHCRYRPGGADERLSIRDVHLEYMMAHSEFIHSGGALLQDCQVIGMYLLLGTEDGAWIDDFLANEPYSKAGLFASVERLTVEQFIPERHEGFLSALLTESRRVARARVRSCAF
jgi:uncharacterized protein YciI